MPAYPMVGRGDGIARQGRPKSAQPGLQKGSVSLMREGWRATQPGGSVLHGDREAAVRDVSLTLVQAFGRCANVCFRLNTVADVFGRDAVAAALGAATRYLGQLSCISIFALGIGGRSSSGLRGSVARTAAMCGFRSLRNRAGIAGIVGSRTHVITKAEPKQPGLGGEERDDHSAGDERTH